MKSKEWNETLKQSGENPTWKSEFIHGLSDTMWKYEQLRAGQVYAKFMFNTREEAENFALQMSRAEPDLLSRIEPIEASAVWN